MNCHKAEKVWRKNCCLNVIYVVILHHLKLVGKYLLINKKKHRQAYDINVRAMFASTTTGRKGLQKICGTLDLPKPITSKPHNELM